jgi:cytochrome P450
MMYKHTTNDAQPAPQEEILRYPFSIQVADGDVPRREAGRVVGSGGETASLFSVSDARHNQTRRLVTQAFTVKSANELAPRVVEVTNALVDAMERSGPPGRPV